MKSNVGFLESEKNEHDLYFSYTVKNRINRELISMSNTLKLPLHAEPFSSICVNVALRLYEIEHLYTNGEINPFIQLRTGEHDPSCRVTSQTVRIGFSPVAADPFHWGHLISGLNAIVHFKLDKVIYLIAGSDVRKHTLTNAAIRHSMGQDVLRCFRPLFEYSPIAYDRECDGELGLFYFLKLNFHQRMEVWYLAGSDHYRRTYPETAYPDTIQKLEDHIEKRRYGYNKTMHRILTGFIQRGQLNGYVDTFLPVEFLPAMPFAVSSSMIREAFRKGGDARVFAFVPYSAYIDIMLFNLYGAEISNRQKTSKSCDAMPSNDIPLTSYLAYAS